MAPKNQCRNLSCRVPSYPFFILTVKEEFTLENLLKTPLYDCYTEYGAKVVDFAGWALPIQFEGIIPEHHAVRQAAGLFDVSHMGEVEIKGDDALLFLNRLLSNDVSMLKDYQIQYSIMVNDQGGVVDDVLVYRYSKQHFWVIVNAANRIKDVKWMHNHAAGYQVEVCDISDGVAQLALQGPKAIDILKLAAVEEVGQIKFFHFSESIMIDSISCLISRTGYTGEDGFEIYVKPDQAASLWKYLLEIGKDFGLKPAGLGCRDTLRFEACLPLYGHELAEDISPLEAGLGWVVKLNKDEFIGKKALMEELHKGILRKLTGFEMVDRGIPRGGYELSKDGKIVGFVTTGYYSPTLEKNIGLGLVDTNALEADNNIDVVIRGKAVKAVTRDIPFYTKKYKK